MNDVFLSTCNFLLACMQTSKFQDGKPYMLRIDSEAIVNLEELRFVVCVWFSRLEYEVSITSGYRDLRLNERCGGAGNSQHMWGEAVDLSCVDNLALFNFIKKNCQFDQLILEKSKITGRAWVHVSYTRRYPNRNMAFTAVC